MPKPDKRNTGDLSGLSSRVSAPLTKKDAPLWKDLRILLAAKLYSGERMSSERASKLAGINHIEFLLSLGFYKVFPLQAELAELEKEHG
jgi:hypothetical protein